MPDQFVVPQFIDVEDRIIGPITVRQFLILLVGGLIIALSYRLFDFTLFLLVAIPTFIVDVILAFAKVNGVSVHFFLLNLLQTMRKPRRRVWDKDLTTKQLRERLKPEEEVKVEAPATKSALSMSRMEELSLIVNTGGAYRGEEER